jgi:nicotinate-nucleotide adenylyltransferase
VLTRAQFAAQLGGRLPAAGQRIGLLGGSYNPVHGGHRDISLEALKRLRLDQVWWVVSPQNPLKPRQDMAPLSRRLAQAEAVAKHRRIVVTAIEDSLGTTATVDTIERLRDYFPKVKFVWLMGADNLQQIPRWQRWQEIFHMLPVAVFDRPTYSLRALTGKAARRFSHRRLHERASARLPNLEPPAWVFIHIRLNPLSATALRARR